jgi:hypothetical protein
MVGCKRAGPRMTMTTQLVLRAAIPARVRGSARWEGGFS